MRKRLVIAGVLTVAATGLTVVGAGPAAAADINVTTVARPRPR